MEDTGALATVVGLLGACLVALVLVLVARREAGIQRTRARRTSPRSRTRPARCLADVERREQRLDRARAGRSPTDRHEVDELRAHDARAEPRRPPRTQRETRGCARRRSATVVAPARGRGRAPRAPSSRPSTGLTADDARAELTRRITEQAENDAAAQVRRAEAQARRTADARARRIVTTAVQRLAVATSSQSAAHGPAAARRTR